MFRIIIIMSMLLLLSCSEKEQSSAQAKFQKQLIKQLITAKPGDVITIPPGRHMLTRGLTLNVDNVTIRGAGKDKSILNFGAQIQGAEGLLVNANQFVIEDLAIEDTIGDALKVNEGKHIVIRRVRTEWTGGPKTSNGAYGIYPVQSEQVLIEDCVAIAASDAGIYVGQSNKIIVRRNRVEYNVAGIEIENSTHADVYDNLAIKNTGGILVFNMPNLPKPGHSTRVYNNVISYNNTSNFGAEGTAVASVPAGSGVVINSNDKVEIFNNIMSNNDTGNILIASYFSAGFYNEKSTAANFDPYPEGIFIYDNQMSASGKSPDDLRLKALKVLMFGINGSLPDIFWDGIIDKDKLIDGKLPDKLKICIAEKTDSFINADAGNDFKNPSVDSSAHRCKLEKLTAVELVFGS